MFLVELIYDQDCPNVDPARQQLQNAFSQLDLTPKWQEWDRCDPAAPSYVRNYGSPTILVDGKDVSGGAGSAGADCCRIYVDQAGELQGIPSVEMIISALPDNGDQNAVRKPSRGKSNWARNMVSLPGVGISILPIGLCPACWPAYAGLLGSLGLGAMVNSNYLMPLTAVFLSAALAALGFRARTRHGYQPVALGLVGSVMIILGKFHLNINLVTYGGIFLLIGASVWNSWPRRRIKNTPCRQCVSMGNAME